MESRPTTDIARPKGLRPTKPKRPLSAFNLFYRFKRQKVLSAISQGKDEKAEISKIVEAVPGLEGCPPDDTARDASPQVINDLRRDNIRKELEHNLMPRDTRDRTHRTNQGAMNGAMSFLELGKLMNTSWKSCDDFARGVFIELSEEGREHYRQRLNEYNASVSEGDPLKQLAKEMPIKMKKSTKKRSAGKANLKNVDISHDDSADANMSRLRKHDLDDDNVTTSVNNQNRAAAPSLLNLDKNQATTMAPMGTLRTVSNDYSTYEEMIEQPPPHCGRQKDCPEDTNLMLRVKELEEQLRTEKLRRRVRELECLLGRQRMIEDQLRSKLGVLSHNGRAAPTAAAAGLNHNHHPHAPSMQGGLWSLVSASMIHSVQASGCTNMPSMMATAMRQQQQEHAAPSLQHHAMPQHQQYPQKPECIASDNCIRRMDDNANDNSLNKKQCCNE